MLSFCGLPESKYYLEMALMGFIESNLSFSEVISHC